MDIGNIVKHKPSGIEGKVVARTEYEYDSPQICIQRQGLNNDNNPWPLSWVLEYDCILAPAR